MWFWLGNLFLVIFSWLKVIFKAKKSISRSKGKQKYNFLTNKAIGTCAISPFYVVLTEQCLSETILIIQGHLQGQKFNFKVRYNKISFSTNTAWNVCNTSSSWDFDWKSNYSIILMIQGHLQGQFPPHCYILVIVLIHSSFGKWVW